MRYKAWYKPLSVMIASDKLESINFETKTVGVYMDFDGKEFHKLRMSDFEFKRSTGVYDNDDKNELCEGDIIQMEFEGEKIVGNIQYDGGGFLIASDDFEDGFKWITDLTENDGRYYWIPTSVLIGNMNEHGCKYF